MVYLHGWGRDSEDWIAVSDLAGEPDLLIDLPGFGDSFTPEGPWSVRDYADFAAEIIAHYYPAGAVIVGHSFGGKVAIAIAARWPVLARGLVVVAGTGRWRLVHRLLAPSIRLAKRFGFFTGRFRGVDYAKSNPVMRKILAESLNYDSFADARLVRCPSAFVYGLMDRTTPASVGRKYAKAVRGAKLVELQDYGHDSILSDGKYQVAAVIRELRKC